MTNAAPPADDMRRAVLAAIKQLTGHENGFSREYVIKQAVQSLGQRYDATTMLRAMDAWDDLYRSGVVGYGMNLDNLGFGWSHLTEFGAASVAELNRDPSNPNGYRAVVAPHLKDEPIARSYLDEALDTYNKGTFKASAVMLGCAAEALHLSLRDKLVAKITAAQKTPPPNLETWIISRVLGAIEELLTARVGDMERGLRERFESYWPAWTGLFRMTRNEAGHPKSIDPITRDAMHAALLLFPEHARLSFDLSAWVVATY
ncbi:MAG: hypothetical protein ACRELB_23595 [Polyangiaceae bacterium]